MDLGGQCLDHYMPALAELFHFDELNGYPVFPKNTELKPMDKIPKVSFNPPRCETSGHAGM